MGNIYQNLIHILGYHYLDIDDTGSYNFGFLFYYYIIAKRTEKKPFATLPNYEKKYDSNNHKYFFPV